MLTERRLDEIVPIANAAMDDRTFIEWDKDDIDALNIMKVDVLALGMLTCIKKAFALLDERGIGGRRHGEPAAGPAGRLRHDLQTPTPSASSRSKAGRR